MGGGGEGIAHRHAFEERQTKQKNLTEFFASRRGITHAPERTHSERDIGRYCLHAEKGI